MNPKMFKCLNLGFGRIEVRGSEFVLTSASGELEAYLNINNNTSNIFYDYVQEHLILVL